MKRRIVAILLCIPVLFALREYTLAVDEPLLLEEETVLPLAEVLATQEDALFPRAAGPMVYVNDRAIMPVSEAVIHDQTTYFSLRRLAEALLPDAQVIWANGQASITGESLTLMARPGDCYVVANERYLYVPDGVWAENGEILVPVRTLATAFGAAVLWDSATGDIRITSGSGPLEPGGTYYAPDDVRWLSRIIYAESGNQPMAGKVAVGTVILNRVAHPNYPNTIYDVIFDRRGGSYQFSPARSGSVHREPNASSVVAAKLCLDGAREAEGSLFFNVAGLSCWASRNRTLVEIIGNHSFYN